MQMSIEPRTNLTIDITDFTDDQRRTLAHQVRALLIEFQDPRDDEPPISGWTATALREALARLDRGSGQAQAKVIREGLLTGGPVSRQRVYDLGDFKSERTLRGFTRPVKRIMREMQEQSLIAQDAAVLLKAGYGSGVSADHFDVPAELSGLMAR